MLIQNANLSENKWSSLDQFSNTIQDTEMRF